MASGGGVSRADAALRAIESEAGRGSSYEWGERDCSTLIRSVCRELGCVEPPYGDGWASLAEGRAAVRAVREFGSLGDAHQQALILHSGWSAVTRLDSVGWARRNRRVVEWPCARLQPCDVVSYAGEVEMTDGTRYEPKREELHWTGVVGPECRVWGWTSRGLSTLVSGVLVRLTRMM